MPGQFYILLKSIYLILLQKRKRDSTVVSSETLSKTPRLCEEVEASTSSTDLDDYYTHPVRHTCGNNVSMVHVFMA